MSNSTLTIHPLSRSKPLSNARNAAFIALALSKADLISVVVTPRQSNDAATSFLACRFASQRARRRFARHWAKRTGRPVKTVSHSHLVFAPIAPLPHGRSEAIGR